MQAPVLYIPLAIEWVILITAFMPKLLAGMFRNTPRFGLVLWFTYFASSVAAAAIAIIVTVWALANYIEFIWGSSSIELELFQHLGLWALVAVSGLIIAIINLKTEPLVESAGFAKKELAASAKRLGSFEGVATYEIVFPLPIAFTVKLNGGQSIVISNVALTKLSEEELTALYWHELGHIRRRHNLLRSLVKVIALLTPIMAASKTFTAEVEALTEITADRFAMKKVPAETLAHARAKFSE